MKKYPPLEDTVGDVIYKAAGGFGLDEERLSEKAGITWDELDEATAGKAVERVYHGIARALDLHGPSLVVLAARKWYPAPVALDGLRQVTTLFAGAGVNSYLVWDPATREAVAFDTGAYAEPLLDLAAELDLRLERLFLTHSHPDHIVRLDVFIARGVTPYGPEEEPVYEVEPIAAGTSFRIGGLHVETRATPGHSPGGISYYVTGLARGAVIVGDALFAGSIGGARGNYQKALATNRSAIFTLPDDTAVGPGHGPMTTVGEEKARNPFFPEFKVD